MWLAAAVIVCVALPAAAAGPPAPAGKASVAIWRLRSPGVEPALAGKISSGLAKAIAGLGNFKLAKEAELEQKLRRAGVLPGSPWESVWPVLKVDWVVLATLTGIGGELALDVRLMNGKDGAEVRRATVTLGAEKDEREAALRELAVRLLAPNKWKGSLMLEVSADGAQVFLDDRRLATTPLVAPISDLLPGKHILRITREGYGEFSHFVHIRYNQVVRLKVDLENALVEGLLYEQEGAKPVVARKEKKAPPTISPPEGKLQRVLAWSSLGVGGAAGGAGAALLLTDRAAATGTVLAVSGGLLVMGAVGLFLVAPGEPAVSPPAAVAPAVGLLPSGWWLGLSGCF